MATPTIESVAPQRVDRPLRFGRRLATTVLWLLRAVVTVHVMLLLLQPVLAGLFLSGHYSMLGMHLTGANLVSYTGYALVACALAWSITARLWWPGAAAVLLVAGETVQYFAGMAGRLYLHIPLGVSLVLVGAGLAVGLWHPVQHARTGRKEGEQQ